MSQYLCKTPIKVMTDLDTKETKIFGAGDLVELSEKDADELLSIGAVDGPVDSAKKK